MPNIGPPEGGRSVALTLVARDQATAAWLRRRRQASRPPNAITRPGVAAPTIGPGTAETWMSRHLPPRCFHRRMRRDQLDRKSPD